MSGAARCDLPRLFHLVLGRFRQIGKQPDLVGLGKGHDKMLSFERGLKKLQSENWQRADGFSLKASRSHGGSVSGWYISCGCSKEFGYFFFSVADDLVALDNEYFVSFVREMSGALSFEYGYVYERSLHKGADLYAVGITSGLGNSRGETAEGNAIAKWFNSVAYFQQRQQWRSHQLRDVYEVNFLSSFHLDRIVNEKRLRDWIAESPDRGTVRDFIADRFVWTVPKSDVPKVRETLKANLSLVAYRPDIPPIDDEYRERLRREDPEKYAREIKRGEEIVKGWTKSSNRSRTR